MNIIHRELKLNAKSLIIWCLSMVFLIYAGMVKYSAFQKTGEAVNEFLAQMPAGMMKAMGFGYTSDLTSVAVFYSIFFMYFMLLASVHSAMLGAVIISKEERDKTADFLFVKPVKRHQVITRKIIAALINLVIFNFVTFAASLAMVEKYNTGAPLASQIIFVMAALFILQLLFFGIGLLAGALASKSKIAASASASVILGTFILKVVIDLNEDADFLEFLSPFRYFKAKDLMFDKSIDPVFTILAFTLALVSVAGTYYFFRIRDLKS